MPLGGWVIWGLGHMWEIWPQLCREHCIYVSKNYRTDLMDLGTIFFSLISSTCRPMDVKIVLLSTSILNECKIFTFNFHWTLFTFIYLSNCVAVTLQALWCTTYLSSVLCDWLGSKGLYFGEKCVLLFLCCCLICCRHNKFTRHNHTFYHNIVNILQYKTCVRFCVFIALECRTMLQTSEDFPQSIQYKHILLCAHPHEHTNIHTLSKHEHTNKHSQTLSLFLQLGTDLGKIKSKEKGMSKSAYPTQCQK